MIAKVIVHAATRREAAGRLARVLETTEIQGLRTNRDFLVATLRTSEFLAGDTTTDFIDRVEPSRTRDVSRQELVEATIAVARNLKPNNAITPKFCAAYPAAGATQLCQWKG